jgi:hypothetical protein
LSDRNLSLFGEEASGFSVSLASPLSSLEYHSAVGSGISSSPIFLDQYTPTARQTPAPTDVWVDPRTEGRATPRPDGPPNESESNAVAIGLGVTAGIIVLGGALAAVVLLLRRRAQPSNRSTELSYIQRRPPVCPSRSRLRP